MSFWDKLDPTSNDFLGLGTAGRVLSGVLTGGFEELLRPDPFGAGRNTTFSKTVGGIVTGAATGGAVGFATGGPFGAIVGALVGGAGGGVAGATGATNNFTIKGVAENVGIGVGGGLTGGAASALAGASTTAPVLIGPHLPSAISFPSLSGLWGAAGITGVLSSVLSKTSPNLQHLIAGETQPAPAPAAVAAPAAAGTTVVVPPPPGPAAAPPPTVITTSTAAPAAADHSLLWVLLGVFALAGIYLWKKKKHG